MDCKPFIKFGIFLCYLTPLISQVTFSTFVGVDGVKEIK